MTDAEPCAEPASARSRDCWPASSCSNALALGIPQALTRVGGLQAQEPQAAVPRALEPRGRLHGRRPPGRGPGTVGRPGHPAPRARCTWSPRGAYPTWRAALAPELAALPLSLGARTAGVDVEATRRAGRRAAPRPAHALRRAPTAARRALPRSGRRTSSGVTVRLGVPLVLVPDASPWGWPADSAFGLADEWIPWRGRPARRRRGRSSSSRTSRRSGRPGPPTSRPGPGCAGSSRSSTRWATDWSQFTDEDGRRLYDLPDAPRPPEDVPAPPRLLGEWDTVMLGLADHSRVVDAEVRARLMTSNGRLRHSFMVDGRVVGGWQLTRTRRSAVARRWSRTSASRGPA